MLDRWCGGHSVSSLVVDQIPLRLGKVKTGFSASGKILMRNHGKVRIGLGDSHTHVGILNSWPKPYDVDQTANVASGLPQGVLGSPLFGHYIVELDFNKGRLFVHDSSEWEPPRIAKPIKVAVGKVSKLARIKLLFNGTLGNFYIDTGAYSTFAVNQKFARSAALTSTNVDIELYSSSEKLAANLGIADTISFGGHELFGLEGLIMRKSLSNDGVIGLGLLACFHIWFAFPRNQLWLGERQYNELCSLPESENSDRLDSIN